MGPLVRKGLLLCIHSFVSIKFDDSAASSWVLWIRRLVHSDRVRDTSEFVPAEKFAAEVVDELSRWFIEMNGSSL